VPTPGAPVPPPVTAPKKDEKPKVPSLAQAEKEGIVYLIADADLVNDQTSTNGRPNMPRDLVQATNANVPLVMNIIDELAGNSSLIQARSRSSSARPFSTLNKIIEEMNKGLRDEEKKIDADIEKWKQEVSAKKENKNPNNPFIVVNQRELDEYNSKIADGESRKRELRKKARKQRDGKLTTYQAWNILGAPVLICLVGLGVVIARKYTTAAR
jgi:ABC-type uncharacterized transport system involved in gliding motility auxiliary subunit